MATLITATYRRRAVARLKREAAALPFAVLSAVPAQRGVLHCRLVTTVLVLLDLVSASPLLLCDFERVSSFPFLGLSLSRPHHDKNHIEVFLFCLHSFDIL